MEEAAACPEPSQPFVKVVEEGFGLITNENYEREIVRRYTFSNQNHLTIQVITYGATITSIQYPDKNGVLDDVVLGFDDLYGYMSQDNPYFGATIGRCANRISKGHFKIGDEDYQLSTNIGEHHIHGGFKGFDKVNWKSNLQDKKLVLTYLSKDEEEGYPGEVLASVSFELTTTNDFVIEMKATSSKKTPINLTNHSYFNLAGHGTGSIGLYEHYVVINADKYCHTDENFIPTGMLKNVVNTLWDLRTERKLGNVLPHIPYGGFDQNMCIHKTTSECLTFIARVKHPGTGRVLEIYSNQPGVQFYTANQLPMFYDENTGLDDSMNSRNCCFRRCPLCGQVIRDQDFENPSEDEVCDTEQKETAHRTTKIIGKGLTKYYKHGAICLMPQKYPDSVHRKNFPNCIIKPSETYYHIIKYKFDLCEEIAPPPEDEDVIDDTEEPGEMNIGEENDEEEIVKQKDDLVDTKIEENGR